MALALGGVVGEGMASLGMGGVPGAASLGMGGVHGAVGLGVVGPGRGGVQGMGGVLGCIAARGVACSEGCRLQMLKARA